MKYKKVNSGYDGSPEGILKPEEMFHGMSPDAMLYRHHSDPCGGLADPTIKPLDLATSQKYPYYAVPSTTVTPVSTTLADNFPNFPYQTPYYNQISHTGAGLDLHRIQDTLSMQAPPTHGVAQHHQKFVPTTNNNTMQYHSQYNTQYYTTN